MGDWKIKPIWQNPMRVQASRIVEDYDHGARQAFVEVFVVPTPTYSMIFATGLVAAVWFGASVLLAGFALGWGFRPESLLAVIPLAVNSVVRATLMVREGVGEHFGVHGFGRTRAAGMILFVLFGVLASFMTIYAFGFTLTGSLSLPPAWLFGAGVGSLVTAVRNMTSVGGGAKLFDGADLSKCMVRRPLGSVLSTARKTGPAATR